MFEEEGLGESRPYFRTFKALSEQREANGKSRLRGWLLGNQQGSKMQSDRTWGGVEGGAGAGLRSGTGRACSWS